MNHGMPQWLALLIVLRHRAALRRGHRAVHDARPGRGAGQRVAGHHRRPAGRRCSARRRRSGRRGPRQVKGFFDAARPRVGACRRLRQQRHHRRAGRPRRRWRSTSSSTAPVLGIAMRAVVDSDELVALHGVRPDRLSTLSWAGGSSLAALAGILLVPSVVRLHHLTLLVISAYAAAMVGRLKSLPQTFAGAIGLGLAQSYVVGYVRRPAPGSVYSRRCRSSCCSRSCCSCRRCSCGSAGSGHPRRAGAAAARRGAAVGAVAASAVVLRPGRWPSPTTTASRLGLCCALLMLSLVLLTGYGGYVSLCQFTLRGHRRAGRRRGSNTGLVPARLLSPACSSRPWSARWWRCRPAAARSLPRARHARVRRHDGPADVPDRLRLRLQRRPARQARVARPASTSSSERSFAIRRPSSSCWSARAVLAIRRGRFGRMLIATRDSPAACGTLGFNLTGRVCSCSR